MILATTENIAGRQISQVLGIVSGSTVRSRNVGRDIMAGFKNLVGGEISEYTKLLQQAREEAINRMKEDAEKLGADAIVNIRFNTANITQGASEILVVGTAVKL
jgi:uncharacterized protein YbjQ (UPF0145 family)